MGEEIDLSQFDQIEAPEPKLKKPVDEEAVKIALDRLRSGMPREAIVQRMHAAGYTYEDIEKIISAAESKLYAKKEDRINFPKIFCVAIAAVVLVVIAAYFAFSALSPVTDCGDDTLCTQKIIYCSEGRYKSEFRGITNEYLIKRQESFCSVFVKTISSTQLSIKPGMSMNCLYPFVNGSSDMSSGYSACDGSLADALSS